MQAIVRLLDSRHRAAPHPTRIAPARIHRDCFDIDPKNCVGIKRGAPATMHLILALPPLFESRADKTAALHAPALAHLLAMASAPIRESGGIAAALASRYGVERQEDWPLAAIRVAAFGIDPGTAYWLAADPVTFEVGRADVELARVVDDFDRAEADALLATLNGHFANDDIAFVAPRPDAFFVRAPAATRLSTSPPAAAMRRPLRALLPQGVDAAIWRRYQAEIEMLLHEHPLNAERERHARTPANGVWFSEGGTLPPRRQSAHAIATFASTGIAHALGRHAGGAVHPVPSDLRGAQATTGNADAMVVALDDVCDLPELERRWAAPARDALARGALDRVTLLCDDRGDAVVWNARPLRLWQRVTGRYKTHDLDALLDNARAVD